MMKYMKQTICICLLATILLLQGCLGAPGGVVDTGKVPPSTRAPSVTEYHLNTKYTYRTQVKEEMLVTGLHPDYLLLASKSYPLGKGYAPKMLVTLENRILTSWHQSEKIQLEARAATALYAMLAEMEADGVTDIKVTSAYRGYQYQYNLYNKYVELEQKGISQEAYQYFGKTYIQTNYIDRGIACLTESDAILVVGSYSAPAGASEHQTGLCVDFITAGMAGELTEAFASTEAFAWLSQNAYRFGFILRYPKGREDVTGYRYEPWHYRFVGREAATDIYFGNLTLEEYLGH